MLGGEPVDDLEGRAELSGGGIEQRDAGVGAGARIGDGEAGAAGIGEVDLTGGGLTGGAGDGDGVYRGEVGGAGISGGGVGA